MFPRWQPPQSAFRFKPKPKCSNHSLEESKTPSRAKKNSTAIQKNIPKAQENADGYVVIGIRFASDLFKEWGEFPGPTLSEVKQN